MRYLALGTLLFSACCLPAFAQVYMEAKEVRQVLYTYVSAPNETKAIDVKAALLSQDRENYSLLLGSCLFDLDEATADKTLEGIRRSATGPQQEVTFAGIVKSGKRVDATQRTPLSCSSDRFRAAVIYRTEREGGGDDLKIAVIELQPRTAELFQKLLLQKPDPETDGLRFSWLPDGMDDDVNVLIEMNMTDHPPQSGPGNEAQKRWDAIIDTLIQFGVEKAVQIAIALL